MRLRTHGTGGILIVLGIVLALAAAAGTWELDSAARATRSVVVATRDVPALGQLAPGDVRLSTVAATAVPSGALVSLGQAEGRYVRFGLLAGQVVRAANLAVTASGASQFDAQLAQSARDQPAMRAVTLAVPTQDGAVLARAGDRVDLLAVLSRSNPPQVRVIASNVLVLDRLGSRGAGGAQGAGAPPSPLQQSVLVLAMPLRTAEETALAQAVGQVDVALVPLGTPSAVAPGGSSGASAGPSAFAAGPPAADSAASEAAGSGRGSAPPSSGAASASRGSSAQPADPVILAPAAADPHRGVRRPPAAAGGK